MAKFRWTTDELKKRSNNFIIRGLLAERMSDLNPYFPLAKRLKEIYNEVDDVVMQEEMEGARN